MSKANQAFKQNDEAVSPVIGVILMVAITVVLAAVVFVLVSNLGDTSESAPEMAFNRDDSGDRISIVRADAGLTADQFEIRSTETGAFGYNVAAATALTANTYEALGADTVDVEGGDQINVCTDTVGGSTDVTVTLRHIETNTVVYETTFATLAEC